MKYHKSAGKYRENEIKNKYPMPRTCTFFIGPAGVGKTTLVRNVSEIHATFKTINLDPASYDTEYQVDIRSLIDIDILMEECEIGPNNALLKVFDLLYSDSELKSNFSNELENLTDYDLLVDCPGQLEIYLHNDSFKNIVQDMFSKRYRVLFIYCTDVNGPERKFITSCVFSALIGARFEYPFINLLTKCDMRTIRDENHPDNEKSDMNKENGKKDFSEMDLTTNDSGYIDRLGDISKNDSDALKRSLLEFLSSYGPSFLPISEDEDLLNRLKGEIHACVNLDYED